MDKKEPKLKEKTFTEEVEDFKDKIKQEETKKKFNLFGN